MRISATLALSILISLTGCVPKDGNDTAWESRNFCSGEDLDADCDHDGYSKNDGDCDDMNSSVRPNAEEICDGIDNDCNGLIDDEDEVADHLKNTWYTDSDSDGFGNAEVLACDQPADASDIDGDCDDANDTVYPDAGEICDGIDNDCDGLADNEDADLLNEGTATWYMDSDGDEYGDPDNSFNGCEEPGYVSDNADCDDTNAEINPGATDDNCDGVDDNCDGEIDNAAPEEDFTYWYTDSDGDEYGDPLDSLWTCNPDPTTDHVLNPEGTVYVEDSGDCNPEDATVNDDNRDKTVDCMDPDDDGYTSRGDDTPFALVSGGGQSIDNMSTSEVAAYEAFINSVNFTFSLNVGDPDMCWSWHTGDYGTFLCEDPEVSSGIYATIPTTGLDETHTYTADTWVRVQESATAFVIIPSDECLGETLCTEEFEALLVLPTEQSAFLLSYSTDAGLTLVSVMDLTTIDFNGDGVDDGEYLSNEWYEWSFTNVEGDIHVEAFAPEETTTPVSILAGPGTLNGGNVVFISLNSEIEFHQPTWAR